ncbi:MAG TPA: hypothetical protein DET40_01290 [Lentisphaeria bacterium]|nr:MAG: hypothetical protein A2X45_09455 [Lentisphaerae bacterium GWF2_50_93]HCE42166.1 hypothetical protein [Lentisphaeria bacterium]
MNCEKAREMILSNDSDDASLREHMGSCAECRCLAAEWNSLEELKPVSIGPPRMLDFKIKGVAAARIAGKKHGHQVLIRRIVIYASAACCVLITWSALSSFHAEPKVEQHGKTLKNADMEKELLVFMTELEVGIQKINDELFPENSEPELDINLPEDIST